jgi:hypothetical protein
MRTVGAIRLAYLAEVLSQKGEREVCIEKRPED